MKDDRLNLIGPDTCNPKFPDSEERINNIGQNGNDGLHYQDVKTKMLDEFVSDAEIFEWLNSQYSFSYWVVPWAGKEPCTLEAGENQNKKEYDGTSFIDCVKKVIIEERKDERKES